MSLVFCCYFCNIRIKSYIERMSNLSKNNYALKYIAMKYIHTSYAFARGINKSYLAKLRLANNGLVERMLNSDKFHMLLEN